jgi:basic amino acid/polyamine antiporter, APA family
MSFTEAARGAAALPDNDPGPHTDRLQRQLGIWSAAAVLVGSTIGSGIFRVPSTVAEQVGTVGAMASLWIVGALIALFGALTLAELAALFPRSGGIYVFLREAYGPSPPFSSAGRSCWWSARRPWAASPCSSRSTCRRSRPSATRG